MSPMPGPFKDIETLLMDWAAAEFPELAKPGHTGAGQDFPSSPPLPFAKFWRIGGADDFFTDYPLIETDILAGNRRAAYDLANGMRTRLLRPGLRIAGAVVDAVRTDVAPSDAPWEVTGVRRMRAQYRLSLRR